MDRGSAARRITAAGTAIASLGVAPGDDDGRRMEKRVLTFTAVFTSVVVAPWAAFYYAIGVPVAAAIPTIYIVATIAGLAHLRAARDDRWFRRSQLTMFLTLPPLVHVALGGFANSSGVILFAASAPIGALSFSRVRRPGLVFALYVAIVAAMVPLEGVLSATAPDLDPRVVTLFFAVNIVSVSTIVFVAMRAYVRSRDRLAAALAEERDRSDRLLRNVLPGAIADRLVAGEHPIADRLDGVGVLIADIVDFTSLSETLSPDALVQDLDRLFGALDDLAARHGLTKVKTIGDAYLVITGGLGDEADLDALAGFALDARALAVSHAIGERPAVHLRIGIAVGPIVAGVIGASRFLWDVYGATVNTASRMESTAPPDSIQVTEAVADRLAEGFRLRPRGPVDVKGIGTVHTWFLESRRSA
ncbi:adenylate/guanylate cyclase domain-containing protein [Agromyces indicus]|uniref:Adenylate/guanylate cyclase domain-containing protein n=1 Tax=Agromyces indicus TaxID=758919 RepID=A0ABU1FPS4_9MICO|nr:adenylate/guanylate cyclase domain-containing protein [Agromyces indicus]MDR5693307.1 adenylate/guanylate cyclase domain-containing protein [Agromyces indicus]